MRHPGHGSLTRLLAAPVLVLALAAPAMLGHLQLLAVYGRLHGERDDVATARESLEEALAVFCQLGARKDTECAEQLLARGA